MFMQIEEIELIYFSPTGTSKKIAEAVATGIGVKTHHTDLTPPSASTIKRNIKGDQLAVFAVPVYGGRVPETASMRLSNIKGDATPSVIIVVYGNRAFDDSLLELHDIVASKGFRTVAAAAFVAEHSYSSAETPIAAGRPDAMDLEKAREFGAQVAIKLKSGVLDEPNIPGNKHYTERFRATTDPKPAPISPETKVDVCTLCGVCETVCPTRAISVSDQVSTVKENCIRCAACVKICPTGARVWEVDRIKNAATWLSTEFKDRKEPKTFL